MKQLILSLLILTSCSTPVNYSTLPSKSSTNLKQKLLALKPQARIVTIVDDVPITNTIVPQLQTNILHFIYPPNSSNKLWTLQYTTNLHDWYDTTNYHSYTNGDIGVFRSNNIPMKLYRIRLY